VQSNKSKFSISAFLACVWFISNQANLTSSVFSCIIRLIFSFSSNTVMNVLQFDLHSIFFL
jgi:hypothetical protein